MHRRTQGTVLCGEALEVTCLPAYGFHLASIVERRSGRELLWCSDPHPRVHDELGPSGPASIASWDDGLFIGGWFPMFPSCGLPSPDGPFPTWMHGEVCRRAWTTTSASQGPDGLTGSLRARSAPWEVTRNIAMTPTGFVMRTEALNIGGTALECTFGEHPCFARSAFAGGRIRLDARRASVGVPVADPSRATFHAAAEVQWPYVVHNGQRLAADRIPAAADGRLDHLSLQLADAEIVLESPLLGGALRLTVDLPSLPYALLWESFEDGGGIDVVAVEPCSSPGRTFEEALATGAVVEVCPGETLSFSIAVDWIA